MKQWLEQTEQSQLCVCVTVWSVFNCCTFLWRSHSAQLRVGGDGSRGEELVCWRMPAWLSEKLRFSGSDRRWEEEREQHLRPRVSPAFSTGSHRELKNAWLQFFRRLGPCFAAEELCCTWFRNLHLWETMIIFFVWILRNDTISVVHTVLTTSESLGFVAF